MRIVPCNEEDLQALAEISKRTFSDAFEAANDPKDFNVYLAQAFSLDKLREELQHSDTSFYFVYHKQKPIAYFKLNTGVAQSEFKETSGMELERIYVTSGYQGKGVGKRLLDAVFGIAKKNGIPFVWLGVWQENPKAVAFYERHGFKKIGTHPYDIGADRQTDWLMKKEVIK